MRDVINQIDLPPQVDGQPWWKSAVIYQIYPRSFLDTTGNGVGDLPGVIERLDYLEWLGVDAVWLSPIFTSPMVDHGYDVADYCDIDPLFGDLATFDALLEEAHDRGLRVILDWVANHTSDQHPWFQESRSSRSNRKRDWYIWRDGDRSMPPNNWMSEFGERPAWTWDDTTGAWYLHLFAPEQPDLNWANPEVREAMYDTLRFWLDRGVDGFRMDVIHLIGKPEGLPDRAAGPGKTTTEINEQITHDYLRDVRRILNGYPQAPTSVGEVALYSPSFLAPYHGVDDELNMCFNFAAFFSPWDAETWRLQLAQVADAFDPTGAWPSWVLSNHDFPRHRDRYGGSEKVARAAVFLSMFLKGTPFFYQGEELGLVDADVPPEQQQDPGGWRDGCRAPIPWDASATHGWTKADNWLPFPPESDTRNAESLRADPDSILNLYHDLIELRKREPALRIGDQILRDDLHTNVVAWERRHEDTRFLVVVNMGSEDVDLESAGEWSMVACSDPDPGVWTGRLTSDTAVLLRRS